MYVFSYPVDSHVLTWSRNSTTKTDSCQASGLGQRPTCVLKPETGLTELKQFCRKCCGALGEEVVRSRLWSAPKSQPRGGSSAAACSQPESRDTSGSPVSAVLGPQWTCHMPLLPWHLLPPCTELGLEGCRDFHCPCHCHLPLPPLPRMQTQALPLTVCPVPTFPLPLTPHNYTLHTALCKHYLMKSSQQSVGNVLFTSSFLQKRNLRLRKEELLIYPKPHSE